MDVQDIYVRPILKAEIQRYNELMQEHHYLGSLNPIGETLRYVAVWHDQWVALITFTSAALKCAVRDQWIGWRYRNQFDRLSLVTNNSRFLILPDWHIPNLASRTLSLCQKRLPADWLEHFHHPLFIAGNIRRPRALPRNALQGCQLAVTRVHQGLPPLRECLSGKRLTKTHLRLPTAT